MTEGSVLDFTPKAASIRDDVFAYFCEEGEVGVTVRRGLTF